MIIVKAANKIVSAISLGVFCLCCTFNQCDHFIKKVSPGSVVTFTFILSDNTFVPPVTEDLSPPASRMTGADSPVIADSSIVAIPSMISPSIGYHITCFTNKHIAFRNCDEGTIFISSTYISPTGKIFFAGVSCLAFLRLSACALPRASANASGKICKQYSDKKDEKHDDIIP